MYINTPLITTSDCEGAGEMFQVTTLFSQAEADARKASGNKDGPALLCQHTAGTDGRQFRHVLEDEQLQQTYRLITYDLPYHGRSLPPTEVAWWQKEYRLSRQFFMAVPLALAQALELDRPVFMGSSIGGMLAVDLALYHPTEFRAVIGLVSRHDIAAIWVAFFSRWQRSLWTGFDKPGPRICRKQVGPTGAAWELPLPLYHSDGPNCSGQTTDSCNGDIVKPTDVLDSLN